jgi:hypothetical protein
MIEDMSTPITCLAPALAANLQETTPSVHIPEITESSHIHAEDTGSTADIEDDLILKDMTVLVDGIAV